MLEIHDSISQKNKLLKFISNAIILKKEMEFMQYMTHKYNMIWKMSSYHLHYQNITVVLVIVINISLAVESILAIDLKVEDY